eukprot:GSMAST32.ASY1.ANO1.415.1 assembled CDS
MGGIHAEKLDSVTLQLDGTLILPKDIKTWPRDHSNGGVLEFMHFTQFKNFTMTSSGKGLIDGLGQHWWGIPGIGYLIRHEDRPRLLRMTDSNDTLIENVNFKDPPYWTTLFEGVDGLEIRYCSIEAWRISRTKHTIIDLTAFNTDGFDVTGNDIWIHHCNVWNQDVLYDTFCVKDDTTNVVIENVNASGVGLTIGSIASTVRNITFRNMFVLSIFFFPTKFCT